MLSKFRCILPMLILSIWFLPQNALAETEYSIINLGIYEGLNNSTAMGVNDGGQVVGYSWSKYGDYRAFVWDGSMNNIGDLGGNRTVARNINNSGKVVGWSLDDNGVSRAFAWEAGAGIQNLGVGGNSSDAYAINNDGLIVGHREDAVSGYNRAFVCTPGGDVSDLGIGERSSYALDINDTGNVAGYYFFGDGPTNYHAYFSDGSLTDLGTLGGNSSYSRALNNNDQVVGSARYPGTNPYNVPHAFMWEDNGSGMKDLGEFPGMGFERVACDINDEGQVVGYDWTGGNSGVYRAFLWEDGVMTKLEDLLPDDSGWSLELAYGINDFGQIVGQGIIDGQHRAFLMTVVPEPASCLLMLIGGAGLAVCGRRKAISYRTRLK